MVKKVFFFSLPILLLIISCERNKENCYTQLIRIENLTDNEFNSIIIYDYQWNDSLIFESVESNFTTEFQSIRNLKPEVKFLLIHDNDTIKVNWTLPSYFLDPGPTPFYGFPSGDYTFSIIKIDSSKNMATIGLTDYNYIHSDCE